MEGSELTGREQRILRYITDGWTNERIARELGQTIRAIEAHVNRILGKLRLSNTAYDPGEQTMAAGKQPPPETEDRRRNNRCSFCGKGQDQVRKLVAGPGVFICDQCIQLCNEVLESEAPGKPWDEREGALADLLLELLRHDSTHHNLSDTQRQGAVDQLRAKRVTWTRIGEVFGLSRQEAWERFSRDD